jgi:hypothetical protein
MMIMDKLMQLAFIFQSAGVERRSAMLPGEEGELGEKFNMSTYENGELFLVRIINFVLWFLGIAMLAVIILGAYTIMTAAGNDEQATKGRKIVIGALAGFIVIIISYATIFTILYNSDLMAPRFLGLFN